ncbi:MAG: hypothetical protein R3E60_05385 [Alphaproteobacteria bacterium]
MEPLALTPGQQVLDLLHVDDAIQGFLVAADQVQAGHDAEGGSHRSGRFRRGDDRICERL